MASFLVGLLVMSAFQFGASLVSGYASQRDYREQYQKACDFFDQLNAEAQASAALLDSVRQSSEVSANTARHLQGYAARVQSLADNLQAQRSPYQRTLLIMTVAQAVGAMLLIYFLVRSKEKRDSVLDFL